MLPLLWIERLLQQRAVEAEERTSAQLGEVRREVAAVDDALGQLRAQTDERFEARRRDDDEDVAAALADVSFENVCQLFDRAQDLQGLSRHGVRVQLPHTWNRLKFSRRDLHESDGPATPTIWVDVEDASGDALGVSVIWQPGRSVPDLVEALSQSWQEQGSYPGNEILDAEHIFGWLIKTLARYRQAPQRPGRRHPQRGDRAAVRAVGANRLWPRARYRAAVLDRARGHPPGACDAPRSPAREDLASA